MDRPHLRPRVELVVGLPVERLAETLDQRLKATDSFEGRVRQTAMMVWIGAAHRRWWSPCLDVNWERHGEGSRIVGQYCPHPKLMTAYAFVAIGLTFLGVFSMAWAYVQHIMGELPQCLGGTVAVSTLGLVIWRVHRYGVGRAQAQMRQLGALLEGLPGDSGVAGAGGAPAESAHV